jgi:hypothetical protein
LDADSLDLGMLAVSREKSQGAAASSFAKHPLNGASATGFDLPVVLAAKLVWNVVAISKI